MEKLLQPEQRIVTIVVDMQNDFSEGGTLAVPGTVEVVENINAITAYTRDNEGTVVLTRDQHPEHTPHFAQDNPTGEGWPVHCIAGTPGGEIRDDITIADDDILINKGMGQTDGYSGFEGVSVEGQTIEDLLRPAENEHVIALLTGIAADYCWKNTTLDALRFGDEVRTSRIGKLTIFAVLDTTRAVNLQPSDGVNAIEQIEDAGAIMINTIDVLTGRAFELAV